MGVLIRRRGCTEARARQIVQRALHHARHFDHAASHSPERIANAVWFDNDCWVPGE